MSLHIAKLFKSPLALASAALVIHISAATAADSTGDIQQLMKQVLTGTNIAHSAPHTGSTEGSSTSTTVDAQELVRQVLLGTIGSPTRSYEAIKHSEVVGAAGESDPKQRPVAYSDTQEAVRQVLLGQHHASDAS